MHIPRLRLVALAVLLQLPIIAHAGVYKWIDENGTIVFSDAPPPKGKQATTIEPKPATIEYSKPFDAGEALSGLMGKAADTVNSVGETVGEQVGTVKSVAEQVKTIGNQGLVPTNPEDYEKQLGLR